MEISSARLSSATEDPQPRAPWESFLLAYAATVPLVAAAIAAWWLAGDARLMVLQLGARWAGALLCFFSGVRRGLSFRQQGGPTLAQLAAMLWLFVLGSAALLSPCPSVSLPLELAGYTTLAVADPIAARRGEAPRYFARLRPVQMIIPLACLAALLARLWL